MDNKVYMGNLPTYLKDQDVKQLCEKFGVLKYFNLVKDTTSAQHYSKGYCFFEYADPTNTEKAIKALHQLPCGEKKLKVQKASTGAKTHPAQAGGTANSKQMGPNSVHFHFSLSKSLTLC